MVNLPHLMNGGTVCDVSNGCKNVYFLFSYKDVFFTRLWNLKDLSNRFCKFMIIFVCLTNIDPKR